MSRIRVLASCALLAVLAPNSAFADEGRPYFEGPDIEPWTSPIAVIDVIHDARWSCSETPAVREFTVPTAPDGNGWDRIILQVESIQTGDPWDRLLVAGVNGTELLRATTPRTRMTLRKDVTQYSDVMPEGEIIEGFLTIGSYVGSIEGRMRLEFYDAEPTADYIAGAAGRVISPMLTKRLVRNPSNSPTATTAVNFGPEAPTKATFDLTTSGHGSEEFWFQYGALVSLTTMQTQRTRVFHIAVDGVEVGTVTAMPYLYALLGLGNDNANTACNGPGNSADGDLLHPYMWWTVQREMDRAGLHIVSGEIPQYRLVVDDPEMLELMKGNKDVTVSLENMPFGSGVWITSLSMLLD